MMASILIVEDELAIAELQRDYFALHGFEIDICTTGTDGLRHASEAVYDLIILDLQLPGIDGFELCRQIRSMSEVPILIVSAKKEEVDKIRGFGLGADDFVTKPFSPSELVARAKAHLSRYERLLGNHKKEEDRAICIRELTIDKAARRVHVHGHEVVLTVREFDLLVFLALHPNRVFSKQELFERIWGMESMGDIATVTVHVRRLREKIETAPSNPQFIETIWGAGYRFTV
ncbi:response regulator transcription factor [Paenibacillus sp. UMB4589-SE434]|uniref:response regulator transcription factor n=1 Tax=Paenibacillus sp. UMB4589-SE434 TaxID=3046314 RepID=UPI002550DCCC|nr:response regulator transcription factor [Paenibacillus sp. UMB4589-SE434]MDK8182363.1 response regulator transcription factor [Paenibacillus sp. UMB4589-SE434]